MGESTTIVDTTNVAQWLREGFMRNFGNGLKGVFANLQWAESEVPNRTLLDVSYPSFCLNLSRKSLVRDELRMLMDCSRAVRGRVLRSVPERRRIQTAVLRSRNSV